MSENPGGHARRGRRNPEIQSVMDSLPGPEVMPDIADDHRDLGEGESTPHLVFDGDVVTGSATLSVKFDPEEKESYFGYKLTTRVQPGEDAGDVYARVVTVVNEGVIGMIDDVSDRLDAYAQERESRARSIR